MTPILNFQTDHNFFAIEVVSVCRLQCEISKSYNVLAKRISEYSSVHSVGTVPRGSYQQQASEVHQQWHADHGDQQGDHCQEPSVRHNKKED